MSLETVLSTTRTVRYGLDFSRPVSRDLLWRCLDLARFAPNGANRQSWRFLVLDDPAVIAGVAAHYRAASAAYLSDAGDTPMARSAAHLASHLHQAPVLVLACHLGRLPADSSTARLSGFYGSVFPALWSFMLAARAYGLGTAMTTVHLSREREVAELLGIPYDSVTQVALVVVGHARNPSPGPAPRAPLASFVALNGWSG
jgi:nitroreductase